MKDYFGPAIVILATAVAACGLILTIDHVNERSNGDDLRALREEAVRRGVAHWENVDRFARFAWNEPTPGAVPR